MHTQTMPDGHMMEHAFSFEQLQRTVNLGYAQPLTRNDFRLAMLIRLGHLDLRQCATIDALFDELASSCTFSVTSM